MGAWVWSKGSGVGGGGKGGGARTGGQFVRGSYKSFEGINLTVLGKKKKKNAPVYHGGRGRVGQRNLCVEYIRVI